MISFTDFIKISQKNKLLTVYKELFLNTTFFSFFYGAISRFSGFAIRSSSSQETKFLAAVDCSAALPIGARSKYRYTGNQETPLNSPLFQFYKQYKTEIPIFYFKKNTKVPSNFHR